MSDKWHYLYTFLQSNLLEIPIYYLFYRRTLSGIQNAKLVTFSNSITHPIVFFGFMALPVTYLQRILLAEAFAVLAEAILHRQFGGLSWNRAVVASFLANLVSWQVAPILTYFLFF